MKRLGAIWLGFFGILLSLTGCSSKNPPSKSPSHANIKGEYIYRQHEEHFLQLDPPTLAARKLYPWEEINIGNYPKITKDFFRCKGSSLNPVRLVQKEHELCRFYDCGGAQKHSLILRDQKEFVYPILIDLLNYIQTKTGKRVVITSGHCCPDHYLYIDSSSSNSASKHQIGAEVDFYVQDLEQQPEKIVNLILAYYQETSKYKGMEEFEGFKRYEKSDVNVSTPPWYNKEIFIKLFKKEEGRDFDNRHPYPYLSIQVRFDWDLQEKVTYSWDKAFRNLHRW